MSVFGFVLLNIQNTDTTLKIFPVEKLLKKYISYKAQN